ncbi:MAG: hypothetical protein C0392_09115 [Syntrophus sp. (in: bacteria)]|nr:hypothetical protein [Syntrophus sp. (in: bacteria)]
MKTSGQTNYKGIVLFASLLLTALLVSSCATAQKAYHAYSMKGSIIEASGAEIYVCVGTKDGATVGQELNVHRVTVISPEPKEFRPTFKKEYTGKVRITEVLDEHFAKATIVSGKADVNSIVELTNP